MAGEVKSAQITISEHWHDHVHHKTVGKSPRWDRELGVVCACGEVLGWPDPERKETLSAYTKRVASERVDAASAPGRVKGAFGEYPSTPVPTDDPVAIERREIEEAYAVDTAGDPGPDEPEPEVDWGEPPADEPEPEVVAIEDGDSEDVGTAPIPADAVPDERGNMISGGMSYGQADEAQAAPWGSETAPVEPPQWEGLDDTPEREPDPADGYDYGSASKGEIPSNEGIGSEVVPYAGTPIMPTEAEVLDPLSGRLAPLDPTLPYTPADVELKIVEILRQLENSELFLRQQLARLHAATHNHDYRYNLALHQSEKKAQDQRKAEAWLATERERREMTEADMLVRALRDSQHNLRAQLSGFQSVSRSLAVSMVNALDGREKPGQAMTHRLPPEPSPWNR